MSKAPQVEYAELRTLTPELGVFTVTGTLDDVMEVKRHWSARYVSDSAFNKAAYGRAKRLAWF